MTRPNIIAVPDADTAGAIMWWRLSGDTDGTRLASNWASAGLPSELLPKPPTPTTALNRAVNEQREARRLARPLEGRHGWALVDEDARGENLDYHVLLKVAVNALGRLEFFDMPKDPTHALWSERVKTEIESAYNRHLDTLSHSDISSWIVSLAGDCNAVVLRDTGGIYFVPRPSMERWQGMVDVIRASSSHTIFEVPALRSDEAVAAIIDAIAREAQSEAEAMETEMADEGNLGSRALRGRVARVENVRAKVEAYERLLGRKLENLHLRLDALKANLAAAALAAMAAD